MPTHRYIPKSFFVNEGDFGIPGAELLLKESAAWAQGATPDQAEASVVQHMLAQAINARIEQRYRTRLDFTKAAGLPYERLGRVLRGEYIMRVEEIGNAQRLLGLRIAVNEVSSSDSRWAS